jgi:hypothetical protein
MTTKKVCTTGCELFKNYKDCPYNNKTDLHKSIYLTGKCKVINEHIEREAQERKEKRKIEEKTCPDCGSIDTKIVRSIPQGEIRYGGHNSCVHIRQCKKCKTVW